MNMSSPDNSFITKQEVSAIAIRDETLNRLHTFGIMNSTYDSILMALMDHADKTNFQVERES